MRIFVWIIGLMFLVILGAILIFGHKKSSKPTTVAPVVHSLPEYASTDATVTFTTDGRVNGDDTHRAIRITVSRDQRLLEIVQGYSGNVIDSHSFANSSNAYDIFLRSLNNSGYTLKRKSKVDNSDYRGQCPLGNRYIMSLRQNGTTLSQLWTSDCGTNTGNFGGVFATVQALFQNQITDYETLTSQAVL